MEFQREKYQSSTVAFPKIMKDFQHSAKKYLFKRLEHILHVPGIGMLLQASIALILWSRPKHRFYFFHPLSIALIINPAAQFWELLLYCGEYINSEEGDSLLMQELLSILTAPATPAKDRASKFLEHEALMGSVASPEEK